MRFYIKYIDKNISKIERGSFHLKSLTALPGWDTIMGFQFENLVLNNRPLIHKALHINPEDIISENPFYQRKTSSQPGCQIDYLIQTKFGALYVCEIKFSKNEINATVIQEVQKKIDALKHPKAQSYHPVLIHVNGVTSAVYDSDYFASIIDVSTFLEKTSPG